MTRFFSAGALVAAAVLLAGCRGHDTTGTAVASGKLRSQTPSVIYVATDRSESTDKFRTAMLDQLDLAADMAASKAVTLEVWAFDTTAVEIYSGAPGSHDDLANIKRKQLAPDAKHPRRITRPALLLEAWIHDRALHPSASAYAVILSDGDSEVYTDKPRFRAALRTLGKDPGFHLALVGLSPEDHAQWDDALAAAMPGRYVLAGTDNGQAALAHFLQGASGG